VTDDSLSEEQQLERLKGHRLGPYLSFNPVSATQIWQWCSAMGDNNPGYLPGDNQIAPAAMMQMWTMRDINDDCAPGSTEARQYQVFTDMETLGYPANVAVSYDITFHLDLKIDDRPRHYSTVVNISDKKTTGLGQGYFVTERVEYMLQDESLFAEALITYFQYLPAQAADKAESATASDASASESDQGSPAQAVNDWQPDFENLDTDKIAVGDQLPELLIPITHKLIVGGAIATQDFIPVHHNVPAARAAAMPDIFMNILTTSGLLARYLGNWAGRDARLKHIKFNLMAPNLPGDSMVMEGEVAAVTPVESGVELEISFGGRNGLGYHTRGGATLALPGSH